MWYFTDEELINLAKATRISVKKFQDGRYYVVAYLPGWIEVRDHDDTTKRVGPTAVKLVDCGPAPRGEDEGLRVVELIYRALRAGVVAANLDALFEIDSATDERDG